MSSRTPTPNTEPAEFRAALRARFTDDLDLSVDLDGHWTILGDLPQADLDAFVAEHYPGTVDPEAEFREAVETATSVADLKAALLGTRGPGAQARRPT